MPPKGDKGKGKASSSSTKPRSKKAFTPWDTQMGFTLLSQREKDFFDSLVKRKIMPTRFMDTTATKTLGLHEDCKWLLNRVGALEFFLASEPTFEELTLEFLCTLKVSHQTIRFRLRDEEEEVDIAEFFQSYNVPLTQENMEDETYNMNVFWRQLTGEANYDSKTAKASQIAHPTFRYLQRVLAKSVFARSQSDGTVRSDELWALWCMAMGRPWEISKYLLNHWQAVQAGTVARGDICIGGYVTILAEFVDCDLDGLEAIPGSILVDLRSCSLIRIAKKIAKNRFLHTVKGRANQILLPRVDSSVQNPAHWLMQHIPDIPHVEGVQRNIGGDEEEQEEPSQQQGEDIHMEDAGGQAEGEDTHPHYAYPQDVYTTLEYMDTHLEEHTLQLEAIQQQQNQILHNYAAIQREMTAFQATQEQLLEAQQQSNTRQTNMERMLQEMHNLHFPPPPP